jgi:hypothetical protein
VWRAANVWAAVERTSTLPVGYIAGAVSVSARSVGRGPSVEAVDGSVALQGSMVNEARPRPLRAGPVAGGGGVVGRRESAHMATPDGDASGWTK